MSQDFPSYRGQMEYRCLGCGKTHPGDSLLYTVTKDLETEEPIIMRYRM